MTAMNWIDRAATLAPLLAYADSASAYRQVGIVSKIFSIVPSRSGVAVGFGRRAALARWGRAVHVVSERTSLREAEGELRALQGEGDLDLIAIDADGAEYDLWRAIGGELSPTLAIVRFNPHVPFGVAAAVDGVDREQKRSAKDFGAAFQALCQ